MLWPNEDNCRRRKVWRIDRRARPTPRRVPCSTTRPCSSTTIRSSHVNGREPMGDDQRRPAVHQILDRSHDGGFGGWVEGGGWFIEQENRRVLQEGARDPDALSLPDAEMSAAFSDRTLITRGMRLMNSSACARRAASRISASDRFRTAIGNILAHGGGKKKRVLKHDRNLRPQ